MSGDVLLVILANLFMQTCLWLIDWSVTCNYSEVCFNRFDLLSLLFIGIEWVDIKHRTAVGVLMSLDWSISTAVLPIVAYFVNDWRDLTATVTTPLFLAMITWW